MNIALGIVYGTEFHEIYQYLLEFNRYCKDPTGSGNHLSIVHTNPGMYLDYVRQPIVL